MAEADGDDFLTRVDPWVALEDGRAQLLRAVEGLDEGGAALPVHDGAWTVADLLTHLAAWDELAARALLAVGRGASGPADDGSPGSDWDVWNTRHVAAARGVPLVARLERLTAARDALLDAAAQLDASLFDRPFATPWGIEDTPRGCLIAQALHDGVHAGTIAAALRSAPGEG